MIGTALGPYRVDRELGSGGMGTVYAATVAGRVPGLAEGAVVALKLVHPHLLGTPGFFKRFLREAEIGKAVVHENVVRTYDADEIVADGAHHHFLVMEYVEGQTLRQLLDELGRVPEELCRHIGREIARGLAAIHAAGAVHRDLKPENVLVTKHHAVKVMDLGIARLADEKLRLSQTGSFVGSIRYAAPECFRRELGAPDHRADLHALGLVLYELASADAPYDAPDVHGSIRRVIDETPRRLGDVNPQLSPFFEEVVHTLLAKRPEERFAAAAELADVLAAGESGPWWKARAKAIRAETRRPLRRVRIPRETAVYGRDAELAKLAELFERARAGDGQVVLIEGEAGIGKSRIVDELVARLLQAGADFDFLFGSYPPGGAATAAGAFSTAFREHFGETGCASWLTQAPALVPAFDALLRGEPAPLGVVPLSSDSIRTCFVHAVRALAAERPAILLIDDLHFATEEARSLFTALALAVPGHRVLLVGTARPGIDETWRTGITRLDHATQVPLARIGPKDLVRLLADTLRSEHLAAELSAQIALKSDGNPFFVFEILRGLREGQFITRRDDGTWVGTRVIAEIRIPSSVLDLVNARVAGLPQEDRDLLDLASCCGFEFDPAVVALAAGLPLLPALKRFAAIEKQHRLVRAAGRRLAFDHHQVQEALYGTLYDQMREAYHAAIADALEAWSGASSKAPVEIDGALAVDLAEHLFRGAQGGRALRYLDAALDHLKQGFLHEAAIRLADQALAVPGLLAGLPRAELLLRIGGANSPLDRLGRRARQEEAIREAERVAAAGGDDALRDRAAGAFGVLLLETSRLEEAEAVFRRVVVSARARGDRQAEAAASGSLGNALRQQGRLAEAQTCHELRLAFHRESGDRRGEAGALSNLALVHCDRGRAAEARALYESSLQITRDLGDRDLEATVTNNLANVLRGEGEHAAAREWFERALALSREVGSRMLEAMAAGNLGLTLADEGLLVEALPHVDHYLALSREMGFEQGEASALSAVCYCRLSLGDLAPVRPAAERVRSLGRKIPARDIEAQALRHLSWLADEEGAFEEAVRLQEECLALDRAAGYERRVVGSLLGVGERRLRAGDPDGARAALDEAVAEARRLGWDAPLPLASAIRAGLPGSDFDAARAEFERFPETSRDANLLFKMWQATGDRAHLAEARRHVDQAVAKVPAEFRESMRTNVRLNREILAACRANCVSGDGDARGT